MAIGWYVGAIINVVGRQTRQEEVGEVHADREERGQNGLILTL